MQASVITLCLATTAIACAATPKKPKAPKEPSPVLHVGLSSLEFSAEYGFIAPWHFRAREFTWADHTDLYSLFCQGHPRSWASRFELGSALGQGLCLWTPRAPWE